MKLTIFTTSALAIAGVMLLPSPAHAQVATTYNADDLFLGFRASGGTGATVDYLVDIGQASQYRDFAGTSFTLNLGNIKADLIANFGANWNTRADLFWSVSGATGIVAVGSDPNRTLYASREETTYGTISQLWPRASSTSQGTTTSKMSAMGQAYLTYLSTANSNFGVVQNDGDTNSYASYMPGGTTANSGPSPGVSFAVFNPTIEGSFANGAGGTQLDLVRLLSGSGTGAFDGTFTIDNNANVTFNTSPVPTPEPGSFAILAAGAGLLGLLRRRRIS